MSDASEPITGMEGDPVGSLVTSQSPATRSGASSTWEFASVLQFVRLAQSSLHLQPISADALEQAVDSPAEHNNLLSDLCARLLHSDPDAPVSEKEVDSWELSVQRKLNKQWLDSFPANPMAGRSFGDLTPMLRGPKLGFSTRSPHSAAAQVQVLHALCEWRSTECPVIKEAIRKMLEETDETAKAVRAEPFGVDAQHSRYYSFSPEQQDCWVFKESHPKQAGSAAFKLNAQGLGATSAEPTWGVECTSLAGMQELCARLGGTRNAGEKAMHELLRDTILPPLVTSVEARAKATLKARALEAAPRKRSDRLQVVAGRKEEEERARAEKEQAAKAAADEQRREDELKRRSNERDQHRVSLGLVTEGFNSSRQDRLMARQAMSPTYTSQPLANGTDQASTGNESEQPRGQLLCLARAEDDGINNGHQGYGSNGDAPNPTQRLDLAVQSTGLKLSSSPSPHPQNGDDKRFSLQTGATITSAGAAAAQTSQGPGAFTLADSPAPASGAAVPRRKRARPPTLPQPCPLPSVLLRISRGDMPPLLHHPRRSGVHGRPSSPFEPEGTVEPVQKQTRRGRGVTVTSKTFLSLNALATAGRQRKANQNAHSSSAPGSPSPNMSHDSENGDGEQAGGRAAKGKKSGVGAGRKPGSGRKSRESPEDSDDNRAKRRKDDGEEENEEEEEYVAPTAVSPSSSEKEESEPESEDGPAARRRKSAAAKGRGRGRGRGRVTGRGSAGPGVRSAQAQRHVLGSGNPGINMYALQNRLMPQQHGVGGRLGMSATELAGMQQYAQSQQMLHQLNPQQQQQMLQMQQQRQQQQQQQQQQGYHFQPGNQGNGPNSRYAHPQFNGNQQSMQNNGSHEMQQYQMQQQNQGYDNRFAMQHQQQQQQHNNGDQPMNQQGQLPYSLQQQQRRQSKDAFSQQSQQQQSHQPTQQQQQPVAQRLPAISQFMEWQDQQQEDSDDWLPNCDDLKLDTVDTRPAQSAYQGQASQQQAQATAPSRVQPYVQQQPYQQQQQYRNQQQNQQSYPYYQEQGQNSAQQQPQQQQQPYQQSQHQEQNMQQQLQQLQQQQYRQQQHHQQQQQSQQTQFQQMPQLQQQQQEHVPMQQQQQVDDQQLQQQQHHLQQQQEIMQQQRATLTLILKDMPAERKQELSALPEADRNLALQELVRNYRQ